MPSSNHIAFVNHPIILLENEELELEQVEALQNEWKAFDEQISQEWPVNRVFDYLLEKKREKYARAKKYMAQLELKNRDARVNGDSFKERNEKYAKKIRIGASTLSIYQNEAEELKKKQKTYEDQTLGQCGLIQPWDVAEIEKVGMTKFLDTYWVF